MGATLSPACKAGPIAAPDKVRDVSDGRLMPPERVANGVWVMRQPDRLWAAVIGNVTIVDQRDGIVLIDTGGTIADGKDVVAAVRQLTSKPIKAVAITHWHNDHPLGLSAILTAFPRARVISTAATREFIASETKVGVGKADPELDAARLKRGEATLVAFRKQAENPKLSAAMREQYQIEADWIEQRIKRQVGGYAVLPGELVTDRLRIDDPTAPVELRFFGTANTRGDLIAWLPRQRVVVTGDAVVLPTPYGFDVSTKTWLAVLGQLRQLPFTALIPGHGKVQRDRAYLDTLEWSMRDMADRAGAAAAQGLTREQALERFDRSEQRARFRAADDWTRYWLDKYWLEGMFTTAFDEAKGIPAPGK
jgi:glyoxylase-like metal-dependent hydrolase (beta-lactamase superfamily II)